MSTQTTETRDLYVEIGPILNEAFYTTPAIELKDSSKIIAWSGPLEYLKERFGEFIHTHLSVNKHMDTVFPLVEKIKEPIHKLVVNRQFCNLPKSLQEKIHYMGQIPQAVIEKVVGPTSSTHYLILIPPDVYAEVLQRTTELELK